MRRGELLWPSTYCYVKERFCRVGTCKGDGKCEGCEWGLLRRYAARDTDRIHELREDNDRLKHALQEVCDRLWYYFGTTDGKFSSNQAANVYDTAKYYLDGGKPSES